MLMIILNVFFVTGGAGFIGSNFINIFAKSNPKYYDY